MYILQRWLIILFYVFSMSALAGQIALSFDDAPTRDSKKFTGVERTAKLIQALKRAKVEQVVFFCNTIRFDKVGRDRIKSYTEAGHLIAHHGHAHLDLSKVTVAEFEADFLRAHEILKGLPNFKFWFRFPYLREGGELKRDLARDVLEDYGYQNGYVTVDNFDWYLNALYLKALKANKKIDQGKLKALYVQTLWQGVLFYDNLARDALAFSPKHILLLHENDLAAMFIADFVTYIRQQGWEIISPEQAYSDPIAAREPDSFYLNQGRIAALAEEHGYHGALRSDWESAGTLDALFLQQVFLK